LPSVNSGGSGIFADLVERFGELSLANRWEIACRTLARFSGLAVSEDGVSWLASNALSLSISALADARSWGVSSGLSLEGPTVRRVGPITPVFRWVVDRVLGWLLFFREVPSSWSSGS
jgi:hypothetical protein